MEFRGDSFRRIGLMITAFCVIATFYVMFLWPEDITADRNEERHILEKVLEKGRDLRSQIIELPLGI